MRTALRTAIIGTLAIALHGVVFIPRATAQCGYSQWSGTQALQPLSPEAAVQFEPVKLLRAVDNEGDNEGPDGQIVGFWKFRFVSEGTPGIPDGTVIDNGFAQWHSDGTEITNSLRPPATGNFCLGVWQRVPSSGYALNHFALGWDLNGNFIGPVQIRENVNLDRKGNQYAGTFTIDQYDPAGNALAHVQGQVTGTRITVATPLGNWF